MTVERGVFGGVYRSMLDDDELAFLDRLIAFWNAHPAASGGVATGDGTIVTFDEHDRLSARREVQAVYPT